MELKRLLEVLWRRKWIVIQAALAVVAAAVAAALLLPPVYEAKALIVVATADAEKALLSSLGLRDVLAAGRFVDPETETKTRISLATVAPLVEQVVAALQIRDDNGDLVAADELLSSPPLIGGVLPRPALSLSALEETPLIQVTARSADPDEAAMLANTLAAVCIGDDVARRRQAYGQARSSLDARIAAARARYGEALDALRDGQASAGVADIQAEIRAAVQRMAGLLDVKAKALADAAAARSSLDVLKAQLRGENPARVSGAAIRENPQIETLKKALSEQDLALAGLLAEKTRSHPDVVAAQRRRDELQAQLGAEIGGHRDSAESLQALERQVAAAEAQAAAADAQIRDQEGRLQALPERSGDLARLTLEAQLAEGLCRDLQENRQRLDLAEAAVYEEARVVQPAKAPAADEPASPNKKLCAVLGVFLGGLFGLGLALLFEYLDETLYAADGIRGLGLPVLGVVPRLSRRARRKLAAQDPRGRVREAYRALRHAAGFAASDRPLRTLVVASALRGEGSTTTAINLAVSLALAGKRTLLVDADLRRPGVALVLGLRTDRGLANVLADGLDFDQALQDCGVAGLRVLAAGPAPADPAGLIESPRLAEVVRAAAERFDAVIVDTPALETARDAAVFAAQAGACILVVEPGRETAAVLGEARAVLEAAGATLRGVAVNKLRPGLWSGRTPLQL